MRWKLFDFSNLPHFSFLASRLSSVTFSRSELMLHECAKLVRLRFLLLDTGYFSSLGYTYITVMGDDFFGMQCSALGCAICKALVGVTVLTCTLVACSLHTITPLRKD